MTLTEIVKHHQIDGAAVGKKETKLLSVWMSNDSSFMQIKLIKSSEEMFAFFLFLEHYYSIVRFILMNYSNNIKGIPMELEHLMWNKKHDYFVCSLSITKQYLIIGMNKLSTHKKKI
jgi:hypothetical protein